MLGVGSIMRIPTGKGYAMTVWQWLSNGWALFHLVGIGIALGVVHLLDRRDKD